MSTTTANIHPLTLGTGLTLHNTTLLPALESATESVILVTCFWSPSPTLTALSSSLLKLSSTALQSHPPRKIKVRIGFSSSSLFQKLFHTTSSTGRIYDPAEWTRTLGLPGPEDLGGLDLEVKSQFYLPFSVWHPKFLVVDRQRVYLPSCNVSWEEWLEGCVGMSGPIVNDFLHFWRQKWGGEGEREWAVRQMEDNGVMDGVSVENVPCKFLPSRHHRNPNFRLPWQRCAPPPDTTLNLELQRLFAGAKREIFLQTPNVTSPPVLDALIEALNRGVDVTISTSERLMILEQLVTAGTTTARCMKYLIRCHQRLSTREPDEEAGLIKPGRLLISYYQPKAMTSSSISGGAEPVQAHFKLTVVDRHSIVFGSGNMDRASWYTSQELGVCFYSDELSTRTLKKLEEALEGRKKLLYDSDAK